MEKIPTAPRALSFSTRLYQMLLMVYPAEFRRVYRGPMLQVFRDCCRRALREGGFAGLLPFWGRTILDTVQTAIEEHSQRDVEMNREKFIKLSGWALVLGGLGLTLGMLASSRPEIYNPYSPRSWAIDPYIYSARFPLYVMGFILLSVGYTGLFIRYGERVGQLGRFWLALGALSGVIAAAGGVGLSIVDSNPWWSIFFFGTMAQFLGLAFFGLANLGQRALPRWNILPVLTGLWLPLLAIVSIIVERVSGRFVEIPVVAVQVTLGLTLAGLFGLGYLLQSDSRTVGRQTAAQ
jgi:hypothetical protein